MFNQQTMPIGKMKRSNNREGHSCESYQAIFQGIIIVIEWDELRITSLIIIIELKWEKYYFITLP